MRNFHAFSAHRARVRTLLCLTAVSLAGCSSARATAETRGFAVVELFTSEGCSSCPAADAVFAEIARDAERSGRAVFPLAFHVDYWDSSAWRDPYSARWASQHQRTYAAALRGARLYTPQMIVDGREEFIGSHAGQARASIARALERTRRSQLRLHLAARGGAQRVVVKYELTGAPAAGSVLRVALVQPEADGSVTGGENAGRKLHHVNIVRAFDTQRVGDRSGQLSVAWPTDVTSEQRKYAFVIGYLQQPENRQIDAAARSEIGP